MITDQSIQRGLLLIICIYATFHCFLCLLLLCFYLPVDMGVLTDWWLSGVSNLCIRTPKTWPLSDYAGVCCQISYVYCTWIQMNPFFKRGFNTLVFTIICQNTAIIYYILWRNQMCHLQSTGVACTVYPKALSPMTCLGGKPTCKVLLTDGFAFLKSGPFSGDLSLALCHITNPVYMNLVPKLYISFLTFDCHSS